MQAGCPVDNGTIAVIGAGTGLGKAFIVWDNGGQRKAYPCEGGHINLICETKEEWELSEFIRARLGVPYVVMEHVLSGGGLSLLHEFLTGQKLTPSEISPLLDENSATACWFSKFYALAARNFALDVLATGGVYVSGGIAASHPALITNPKFSETFLLAPAYNKLLTAIPVRLVTDKGVGLNGAAYYAMRLMPR